jgi:hypothetical protein
MGTGLQVHADLIIDLTAIDHDLEVVFLLSVP